MVPLIFLAFVAVPLVEIAVFIEIGGLIGLWPTLAIIILTAFVGAWQLRIQGMATLSKVQYQLDKGALPTRELFDGGCLLVAGVLLLTPGFVTDSVGLLLFVKPVRDLLRRVLARKLASHVETTVWVDGRGGPRRSRSPEDVVEGEYRDLTEEQQEEEEEEEEESAERTRKRLGG